MKQHPRQHLRKKKNRTRRRSKKNNHRKRRRNLRASRPRRRRAKRRKKRKKHLLPQSNLRNLLLQKKKHPRQRLLLLRKQRRIKRRKHLNQPRNKVSCNCTWEVKQSRSRISTMIPILNNRWTNRSKNPRKILPMFNRFNRTSTHFVSDPWWRALKHFI